MISDAASLASDAEPGKRHDNGDDTINLPEAPCGGRCHSNSHAKNKSTDLLESGHFESHFETGLGEVLTVVAVAPFALCQPPGPYS